MWQPKVPKQTKQKPQPKELGVYTLLLILVDRIGLEPMTNRLKVGCSTN